MKKFLSLALASVCSAASAQTPASNPMPDGSRDMYVGLGIVSAPAYEGAGEQKESALPVLQAAWSNGIFISGLSAGMHLSNRPSVEFGPLVALQQRRDESGLSSDVGIVTAMGNSVVPGQETGRTVIMGNRLTGMDVQHSRLQVGGFFNYYVAPQVRLTNSVLYGSGNGRNGALLRVGLQHFGNPAPHHFLSVGAGLTLANRSHNQEFFGVTPEEAGRGPNHAYRASGGLRDIQVNARWNWTFTPSWLLTTGVQASRLQGSAGDSPLVERSTMLSVSTALAFRF